MATGKRSASANKRNTAIKARKPHATPAAQVDQQLARYQSMRDFSVTAEPSGSAKSASKTPSANALPFVIQKHAASHFHYDFRLGWNGVLKSWACAKGPSYFTGDRRLAVQVEDHPIDYGGFEGIIPQGQYGGGTVMLWDQGTWEPQPGHTDVDAGLRSGSLKFTLHGTKMHGNWTLVRMGGKAANEKKPNWLLIKEHDEFERKQSDIAITDEAPHSVVTGRSLEEIAANQDHVWNSNDPRQKDAKPGLANPGFAKPGFAKPGLVEPPAKQKAKPEAKQKTKPAKQRLVPNAAKEALPEFIPPQLASQAAVPPATEGWLHELKLDGYRIQARKQGSNVQLITRSGLDWTHRMRALAADLATLPADTCILDGEVVVLSTDGTTSFADLQAAFQDGVRKPLTYFAFDLLHLNGQNLRKLALIERKQLLQGLLHNAPEEVRFSEHLETSGEEMFDKACELQAEGIISKRLNSPYVSGRSTDWVKIKCIREQEFVVGGFTLPSKGHAGLHAIGALLLGYYSADGKLIYAGRTGTGFTQKTHRSVRTQLETLKQTANPFTNAPSEPRRGAIWVKPTLVAQVRFATWTADNLVRQASFQGLREDKKAAEVTREEPSAKPPTAEEAKPATKASVASTPKASTPKASTPKASTPKTLKNTDEHAPIRLTHPDKVIDAASGLTKQKLADYYWTVAAHMLPFIAGRPLSIVRCPEGSTKPCFFQKHTNVMLPPGVESVDVPDKKTGKPEAYITLSTPEALAGLAQVGVLEIHPWGSRNDDLEHPDRVIIDLDPDESISWSTLAAAAADVRKHLKSIGLESFLKSTGGKGLHVVVPVAPTRDWTFIKQFAHSFVLELEKAQPSLYLTKMSKAARKGRIYLDYLRNERGATAVAVFSPRARPQMPVSVPLAWSELKLPERPVFTVAQFDRWKDRLKRDPWKQLPALEQKIDL